MRHNGYVSAILAGQSCYGIVRTIRIARILIIAILGNDVVIILLTCELEFPFAMIGLASSRR